MLFQSPRAHCLAPGGPESIWNHLGAPVRSTRVPGRLACGFRTDLHFADAMMILHLGTDIVNIKDEYHSRVFGGWSLSNYFWQLMVGSRIRD
jgi:hypothetical protein